MTTSSERRCARCGHPQKSHDPAYYNGMCSHGGWCPCNDFVPEERRVGERRVRSDFFAWDDRLAKGGNTPETCARSGTDRRRRET